nr:glutaredoxin-like protein C5orf63 homolog isoform X1 [Peromyscus maniculatus bairdii]
MQFYLERLLAGIDIRRTGTPAGIVPEGDLVPVRSCCEGGYPLAQDPCPLCDEAREVLKPYKDRFILQEVDITLPENSTWYERYRFDIPVFHLNGQFLMMHRVNTSKLEKQLLKLEQQVLKTN